MNIKELEDKYDLKFEYYNPHPNKKCTRDLNDCYIRAFCKVLNFPYEKVYNDLYNIAKDGYLQMNDSFVINTYCTRYGIQYYYPASGLIFQFMQSHKKGIYMIQTKRHIVAYINGTLYDTKIDDKIGNDSLEAFLNTKITKYYIIKDSVS